MDSLLSNKKILYGLVIGLMLGSFALFLGRAIRTERSDIWAYVDGGQRVMDGVNPYLLRDETPYKYSPPTAFLFIPVALLGRTGGQVLVALMSWGLMIWIYFALWQRAGPIITLATALWCARFHNYDSLNLQINHFILFLLLAGAGPFRKKTVGAFSLGLGIAFKLSPGLLLPVLFLAGHKKTFFKSCAVLIGLLLLPTFVWWIRGLELSSSIDLYKNWLYLLKVTTPFPAPTDPILQSVAGGLWSVWNKEAVQSFLFVYHFVFVSMVIITFFRTWKSYQLAEFKEETLDLGLSAILILTVIFSPLAWKHAYLLCLPGIFCLLRLGRWRVYWISLFLATVLPSILNLWKINENKIGDITYSTVIGAIFLWGALMQSQNTRAP